MQNARAETQKRLNLHLKILCDAIVYYIQRNTTTTTDAVDEPLYCLQYKYNHQLTVKCIYSFALPEMKSSEKF